MDMKKIIALTGAVVAIVVIMIAVSMAPRFSSGSMYEEDPVAVVDELTGDVSINHAGLNYTLKEGIGLCPGDKVLVGRSHYCFSFVCFLTEILFQSVNKVCTLLYF